MASVGRATATTCQGFHCPHPKVFRGKLDSVEALPIFRFFSAQECQHKKGADIAHGVRGPSHSYHLAGASSPTPEGLTGQDTSVGQVASAAGFSGPPYNCESDGEPTAKDRPKDTVDAADQPLLPSTTKH